MFVQTYYIGALEKMTAISSRLASVHKRVWLLLWVENNKIVKWTRIPLSDSTHTVRAGTSYFSIWGSKNIGIIIIETIISDFRRVVKSVPSSPWHTYFFHSKSPRFLSYKEQEKGEHQEKTMKQKYDGKGNMWPCFFDMNTFENWLPFLNPSGRQHSLFTPTMP